MGVPQTGCFIRENPIYEWMMTGGTVPLFSETSDFFWLKTISKIQAAMPNNSIHDTSFSPW